jgi:hypothetical protein
MDINFSIGRILLLTYVIIASSYCSDLFSNGLKRAIQENKYAQHLILIILIITLMFCFGNPFGVQITSNQQFNIVIMSLLVYVWFIMTTKLDLTWNIGILILLTIYFLFESKYVADYKIVLKDPIISNQIKDNLINTYLSTQKYLLVAIFGVTLAGTLIYANEKKEQYGSSFNITDFIFK